MENILQQINKLTPQQKRLLDQLIEQAKKDPDFVVRIDFDDDIPVSMVDDLLKINKGPEISDRLFINCTMYDNNGQTISKIESKLNRSIVEKL
ncbi:hypothetical protein ACKP2L_05890 [Oenococcus alcoholitolerans]|uniref:hypothetical protein n=1 Tax=Oenococcus alcoholitolerans TaxID=931074 RepID=UPI003F726968